MGAVIRLENLSKRYRLGQINRRMLYEDAQRWWARVRRKPDPFAPLHRSVGASPASAADSEEVWALRDLNLEIHEGDVVGIIGRNGSGKSTLLKILSRITAPTSGRALIKGRVASLLEVGTGFHQELTGRENVYMNASILGMTKAEIDARFDEIVDFSGVEKFIDTPVKRYSSGMMVRLAFAVAAHLEPEILIIDEVLAVGDAAFQQKCLGKMNAVAREGRTILFVSHQATAVENLCRRGVVLENGTLKFAGTQTEAIASYLAGIGGSTQSVRERTDRLGSGEIRVVEVAFSHPDGTACTVAKAGQIVDVRLSYECAGAAAYPELIVGISLFTPMGVSAFYHDNRCAGHKFAEVLPAKGEFVCRLKRLPLPEATYHLHFWVISQFPGGAFIDSLENAADLTVEGGDFYGTGRMPLARDGVALVDAVWSAS